MSTGTEAADKAFVTLQAQAALKGMAVRPWTDERGRSVFIITWRGLMRQRDSLEEVREFLDRFGLPTA